MRAQETFRGDVHVDVHGDGFTDTYICHHVSNYTVEKSEVIKCQLLNFTSIYTYFKYQQICFFF